MSPIDDNGGLVVRYTDVFLRWRADLRDFRALSRIATRLERLEDGHWGDAQPVGGGVCGGDKSSQRRDIAIAQRLVSESNDAS